MLTIEHVHPPMLALAAHLVLGMNLAAIASVAAPVLYAHVYHNMLVPLSYFLLEIAGVACVTASVVDLVTNAGEDQLAVLVSQMAFALAAVVFGFRVVNWGVRVFYWARAKGLW